MQWWVWLDLAFTHLIISTFWLILLQQMTTQVARDMENRFRIFWSLAKSCMSSFSDRWAQTEMTIKGSRSPSLMWPAPWSSKRLTAGKKGGWPCEAKDHPTAHLTKMCEVQRCCWWLCCLWLVLKLGTQNISSNKDQVLLKENIAHL